MSVHIHIHMCIHMYIHMCSHMYMQVSVHPAATLSVQVSTHASAHVDVPGWGRPQVPVRCTEVPRQSGDAEEGHCRDGW